LEIVTIALPTAQVVAKSNLFRIVTMTLRSSTSNSGARFVGSPATDVDAVAKSARKAHDEHFGSRMLYRLDHLFHHKFSFAPLGLSIKPAMLFAPR
jgi:hypothetical protein